MAKESYTPSGRTQTVPDTLTPLEAAIWRTVAYVDVFDYPITSAEIHRYLDGKKATRSEVTLALQNGRLLPHHLATRDGYYMLPGRESIIDVRARRARLSRALWPEARRYGRLIANLPFVRMVAITGSLAVDNVDERADIDYLVVTANGRVWLARALSIAIVRLAARRGLILCPNYLLAEDHLAFPDHNLYAAREVAQMVPLSGFEMYRRMRQANAWTAAYIPNADGPPPTHTQPVTHHRRWQRLAELPLRTSAGRWLDQWEMERKIRKFHTEDHNLDETDFSPNWCKGHFDAHNTRAMDAFARRLQIETPQKD